MRLIVIVTVTLQDPSATHSGRLAETKSHLLKEISEQVAKLVEQQLN